MTSSRNTPPTPSVWRHPLAALRASVRAKLLFLVLAPLMLGFPIIMGLTWYWGETFYHRLMVSKVGSDMSTAHGYFERVIDNVGMRVTGLANSHELALALESRELDAVLKARRDTHEFDFLPARCQRPGAAVVRSSRRGQRAGRLAGGGAGDPFGRKQRRRSVCGR